MGTYPASKGWEVQSRSPVQVRQGGCFRLDDQFRHVGQDLGAFGLQEEEHHLLDRLARRSLGNQGVAASL